MLPKETKVYVYKMIYTRIFKATLFTIAQNWIKHICPSTGKWIKIMCYIYTIK